MYYTRMCYVVTKYLSCQCLCHAAKWRVSASVTSLVYFTVNQAPVRPITLILSQVIYIM